LVAMILGLFLWPTKLINPLVDKAQAAGDSSPSCFAQVNDGAFGLGPPPFSSEESYEVLVYGDRLYVGMEADNSKGARIWRTKDGVFSPASQTDWEEVAADENGYPFGITNILQNDHIDSLAEFNGYIYASTANSGSNYLGTRVFRSQSGASGTWEDAVANLGAGFGSIYNMNFKDMQVFSGWLCGGTQNWATGAQVWCTSDGTDWIQKNYGGFGSGTNVVRTTEVWSGIVFNNALYFGVQNLGELRGDGTDDVGILYRTINLEGMPVWQEAYRGEPGSYRVDILGELNGFLYISVASSTGIVILRSLDGDPSSWTQVNTSGMNGDRSNRLALVDSATLVNGALYVGIVNTSSGFQLWSTTGTYQEGTQLVDWQRLGEDGLGDQNNVMTQLIVYHNDLYAWTTNYGSGQQVLKESICEAAVPTDLPTESPMDNPTQVPTDEPITLPSTEPTDIAPTVEPTEEESPWVSPTPEPTVTAIASEEPITEPSPSPTPYPPLCTNESESCNEHANYDPGYDVLLPLVMRP
jgi:hypothetical protein